MLCLTVIGITAINNGLLKKLIGASKMIAQWVKVIDCCQAGLPEFDFWLPT